MATHVQNRSQPIASLQSPTASLAERALHDRLSPRGPCRAMARAAAPAAGALATFSHYEHSDGASHGAVPVRGRAPSGETSLSLAGSPEGGRGSQPPMIPGPEASSPRPRLVNSHFNIWQYCTLSWSPRSVWDVSLVCTGAQVTCSTASASHRQAQLAGMVSWSAGQLSPQTGQPEALTYVVLLGSGTMWLHPVLKKTSCRPVQVV